MTARCRELSTTTKFRLAIKRGTLVAPIDERKPGIQREIRYEITPSELIAVIRAHVWR